MFSSRTLTSQGEKVVKEIADRHGISADAVRTLLFALEKGGGTIAQFSHPELGGNGQWMRSGMTMVGDMFNDRLKATVNAVCSDLSSILNSQELFVPFAVDDFTGGLAAKNAWWPAELGVPSSIGSQNDVRYAYFPSIQRLAILQDGRVQIYDTRGHNIHGVQQQQQQQQQSGMPGGLQFTSQNGTFGISTLPILGPERKVSETPAFSAPVNSPPPSTVASPTTEKSSPAPVEETLKTLERIAELHQKGILSDEEFRSKKAELLSRL
jgi:Short C-terminal domain